MVPFQQPLSAIGHTNRAWPRVQQAARPAAKMLQAIDLQAIDRQTLIPILRRTPKIQQP